MPTLKSQNIAKNEVVKINRIFIRGLGSMRRCGATQKLKSSDLNTIIEGDAEGIESQTLNDGIRGGGNLLSKKDDIEQEV